MLVEPGYTAVNTGWVVAEFDRAVQHNGRSVMVMVDPYKHFSGCDMRVVNPVGRVVNGSYRYLITKCFDYLGGGARRRPSADGFVDVRFVAHPSAVAAGSLIGYEVFAANELA